MQASNLTLKMTDVSDAAIGTPISLEFTPAANSTGGQHMRVEEFSLNGATSCRVSGIPSFDVGTLYQVSVNAANYQTNYFFQRIVPGDQAAAPLRLPVDPRKVTGIDTPQFSELAASRLQEVLLASSFAPAEGKPEAQGQQLYEALSPMQKACLLNIAAKANHWTANAVWDRVNSIVRIDQDRVFTYVNDGILSFLENSPRFTHADKLLHTPLEKFHLVTSFKTKGQHATLQVTLMKNDQDQYAADIDIDESNTPIGHTFEVIRNEFQGLTNPYQVHELMLLGDSDDVETRVTPGYKLLLS